MLPVNFASTYEVKEAFLTFLGTRGDFYISSTTGVVSEKCNNNVKEIEVVEKEKDEYLRYVSDAIYQYDREHIEKSDDDKLYVLQCSFNELGAAEFSNVGELAGSGDIRATFDYERMSSGVGTNKTFQIIIGSIINVSKDEFDNVDILPAQGYADKHVAEMLKHMIENEAMPCTLDYKCLDAPLWEESENMGKNQVKSIDGEVVVLEYEKNSYGDVSDEELDASVKVIKKRLDCLGIPYAFGYGKYNPNSIAIMLSPEEISSDVVRMLGINNRVQFFNQFKDVSVSDGNFKLAKDSNNQMCFEVDFAKSAQQVYEVFAEQQTMSENMSTMYLVINGVTISSADINDLVSVDENSSRINFNNLLCMNKEQMDSSDAELAEFIVTIANEAYDDIDISWDFAEYTYYKNGKQKDVDFSNIPWACNKHAVDDSISDIVKNNNAVASMTFNKKDELKIVMDISLDENLPVRFTDTIKAIYNECNFDNGEYDKIVFCIEETENSHPLNCAEIVFSKSNNSMKFSISFDGPNFIDYELPVTNICETDEFFTSRAW